jgi:mono/diheme cytochrome c family protein
MKLVIFTLVLVTASFAQTNPAELYVTHCAACHGVNMEGGQYTALRKTDWRYSSESKDLSLTFLKAKTRHRPNLLRSRPSSKPKTTSST